MAEAWYYVADGEQRGPVSSTELHRMAGAGLLERDQLVWREGMAGWAAAATLEGLFDRTPAAPSLPHRTPPPRHASPGSVPPTPVPPASAAVADEVHRIRTVVLIAGVFNVLVAFVWASTCFASLLAVPLLVLSVFEFSLYAKGDRLPPRAIADRGNTYGVWEVVIGVLCVNPATLVCGILALVFSSRLKDRLA